jgi:hypothetical protein
MNIMAIVEFVKLHWVDICSIITSIIGLASIIVKLTPTLKDDNILLAIVKFIGKYIALNTPTPTERPK